MTKKVKLPAFHRGDTKRYRVEITDPVTGLPVNIGGTDIWITLKTAVGDSDPGAAQTKATQPSDADSANGIGYVTLTSTQTNSLVTGQIYYYDIQWVQPGSPPTVTTVQYGTVLVLRDITVTNA